MIFGTKIQIWYILLEKLLYLLLVRNQTPLPSSPRYHTNEYSQNHTLSHNIIILTCSDYIFMYL